jgi:hypothetical protein
VEEPKFAAATRVEGADLLKGRKSYRQSVVLPKGLPSWWDKRDENADGQVTMAEFLTSTSSRQIEDFEELDVNADGVITAREAEIAAEK